MKRTACLMLLTALSSPASARESFSFMVHGHRIHIAASRHCRSLSCVSLSIPGAGNGHHGRRDDDDVASVNDPASAPAAPLPPAPAAAPARIAARAQTIAPATPAQSVPPAPVQPAPVQAQPAAVPAPTLAAAPSAPAAPPAPVLPQVAHVAEPGEGDAQRPIGDWQTEGTGGLVRIEACGPSLCGYVLDASTGAKGETVLVNMKPKTSSQWTGNVYSRSSGNSYYGTMTLKGGDALRVEACALGSFFCSGNNWTRVEDSRSIRPDVATTPPAPQDRRS